MAAAQWPHVQATRLQQREAVGADGHFLRTPSEAPQRRLQRACVSSAARRIATHAKSRNSHRRQREHLAPRRAAGGVIRGRRRQRLGRRVGRVVRREVEAEGGSASVHRCCGGGAAQSAYPRRARRTPAQTHAHGLCAHWKRLGEAGGGEGAACGTCAWAHCAAPRCSCSLLRALRSRQTHAKRASRAAAARRRRKDAGAACASGAARAARLPRPQRAQPLHARPCRRRRRFRRTAQRTAAASRWHRIRWYSRGRARARRRLGRDQHLAPRSPRRRHRRLAAAARGHRRGLARGRCDGPGCRARHPSRGRLQRRGARYWHAPGQRPQPIRFRKRCV
jgi:hypothetical protein